MLKMTITTWLSSLFYGSYLLSEEAGLAQSILRLGQGLDDLGFQSQQRKGILSFSKISRLDLGPIQPPIQSVPGPLSGVKWLGLNTIHSHLVPSLRMNRAVFVPVCFFVMERNKFTNLTFREPRVVIYSYNKSQRDALFLKFILIKNSTCFGQIHCPSSGVSTLCTQQ